MQKKNQVTVEADDMGNVVRQSKNKPEFGFIRVTQKRVMINSNSFVDYVPLSAIIGGKIEALEALEWSAGEKLSGRIVITEKLNPFNNENPNQHLKMAGQTGVVCSVDGEPIYRKSSYNSDPTVEAVLIAHANGEEIRLANGTATSAKINKKVKPAEAFGIASEEKTEVNEEDNTPSLDEVEDVVEVTDNVEEVVEDFTL